MKKYKIVQNLADYSYTLCGFEKEEEGRTILIFEATTDDEASFIKNQFLHFEPYKPFGKFFTVVVGHFVIIAGKLSKPPHNYEERTLLVLAENEEQAREKIVKDVTEYSKPYKNSFGEEVKWQFDKIIKIYETDFFDTIELYQGKPVEVAYKLRTKQKM